MSEVGGAKGEKVGAVVEVLPESEVEDKGGEVGVLDRESCNSEFVDTAKGFSSFLERRQLQTRPMSAIEPAYFLADHHIVQLPRTLHALEGTPAHKGTAAKLSREGVVWVRREGSLRETRAHAVQRMLRMLVPMSMGGC